MLENTITPEVNDAMEKLVKNHLVFTQEEAGPAELRFADDVLLVSDDSPDPVHTLKVNLYLSGDIKLYCTVLGKNGFAGVWCYICDLAKSEWSFDPNAPFNSWSLKSIAEQFAKDLKGTNRKGVSGNPLFKWIEPFYCVVSLLHILIGIVNYILDNMTNKAMLQIDKMTENEVDNRRTLKVIQAQLDEAKELKTAFTKAEDGGKLLTSIEGKVQRLDAKIADQTRK